MAPETGSNHDQEKKILEKEIAKVNSDSSVVKPNGCVACHLLFNLVQNSGLNEADASERLSELLSEDQGLSDEFISVVEKIHFKERMMGVTFALKSRDAKDRYILSNIKAAADDLSNDINDYGTDVVLRKLFNSFVALQLAQNLGIDFHASAEELYYYMRKKPGDTEPLFSSFLDHLQLRR